MLLPPVYLICFGEKIPILNENVNKIYKYLEATQTAFIFGASSSRCANLFYRLLFEMLYSVTRFENLAFRKESSQQPPPDKFISQIAGSESPPLSGHPCCGDTSP